MMLLEKTQELVLAADLLAMVNTDRTAVIKQFDGKIVEVLGLVTNVDEHDPNLHDDDIYFIAGWGMSSSIECRPELNERGRFRSRSWDLPLPRLGELCRMKGVLTIRNAGEGPLLNRADHMEDGFDGFPVSATLTADALLNAFAADENASARNKIVEVVGVVAPQSIPEIGEQYGGPIYLNTTDASKDVCLELDFAICDEGWFRVGQEVTVCGYCTGRRGFPSKPFAGVQLVQCFLKRR
ncbi:MAG: hypothetical protein IT462_16825 [Planctomycetes bacterium]|nr:hypothetical protein [Planctomycetota bacterium]